MDFVRRILDFFKDHAESNPTEFSSFLHELKDDAEECVVTVHSEHSGFLVFCIFSKDEWSMIIDVCRLTSRNVEEMVRELSDLDEVTSIIVDPRDI